jgi:hypothetical protein
MGVFRGVVQGSRHIARSSAFHLATTKPGMESSKASVIIADDCFGLSTISSMRTSDVMARAVSETLGRRY